MSLLALALMGTKTGSASEKTEDPLDPLYPLDPTFGETVAWYEGETSPLLFDGYLKALKPGYAFKVTANYPNETNHKVFVVKFYDEDAEKEAIDIAEKNKDLPINIRLLGYPKGDNIEILYGLNPGEKLVSPKQE